MKASFRLLNAFTKTFDQSASNWSRAGPRASRPAMAAWRMATAIFNGPQFTGEQRPVAKDGKLAVASVMTVTRRSTGRR